MVVYTHARTRRAHKRLERPAEQGALFAHLTGPAGEPRHIPRGGPVDAQGLGRTHPLTPARRLKQHVHADNP